MSAREDIHTILIIGSGPIVIGQACEFDYSGNQAVRALKEEGYRVVLVNPNPATVMTTPGSADAIYLEPLSLESLTAIIERERPDALLSTMGGQTALNLAGELARAGVLERFGVEIIGASMESIDLAEDRGRFKEVVTSLGLESPVSVLCRQVHEGLAFAEQAGFPLIVRPSFTLGGKGGGVANSLEELERLLAESLRESPVGTALVEESLIGWREFELEVMRDKADNAVVVCSIENVDPMGVHTGDSVTVAPAQTLTEIEYQRMRTAAIDILRAVGVDCGGSNVQFAMPKDGERMVVIEMNPRVSRSSALASKATGFPIARCSAKLAVGYTLDEVLNEITGKTASCFEPVLDYCAVKVPRFETAKFPSGYQLLGTRMKSVGEALALGRSFLEALNKAFRSLEEGHEGLEPFESPELIADAGRILASPHPKRLRAALTLLGQGRSIEAVSSVSGFHPWFLSQLLEQSGLEQQIAAGGLSSDGEGGDLLLSAKRMGLSDRRIAGLAGLEPAAISALRKRSDIRPSYHLVDTCSGEFAAQTPYFYSTWGEKDEGGFLEDSRRVLILASGPNRIGQGLEFDTCCTMASAAWRNRGVGTIMVNANPETVSTDYNSSDRLYLEPLAAEEVLSIMEKEQIRDVVVQLGGQTPLNLAEELEAAGANIIGTASSSISRAEGRGSFADLVRKLGLRQPDNRSASTAAGIRDAAAELGYPVLLRPSFVLGGRSMYIAYGPEELEAFLETKPPMSASRPILVDRFLEDAFEYDLDAVSDGQSIYIGGIMQHIEAAGVHSGDSAAVFPAWKQLPEMHRQMRQAALIIARELPIVGFLNIQFAVRDGELYLLEVNPRASRTVPFLSKASGVDLLDLAVGIWSGESLSSQGVIGEGGIGEGHCVVGWAVKEAVFSSERFPDFDPLLGPEMRSTGEVAGFGSDFGEAFAKAEIAAGNILPVDGTVFVSVNRRDRRTILPTVRRLADMGFRIAATRGTAWDLFRNGIMSEVILKVHEGHPNIIDHLRRGTIALVINTPMGSNARRGDDEIRSEAMRLHIPYTTTTSAAEAAAEAIARLRREPLVPRKLPEFSI
jgi:carbamoyl-phosphate synthase large subunit